MSQMCFYQNPERFPWDQADCPLIGLTDYLFLVYDCRLPKELKRTLMYFASRFNWKKRLPSFVSLVRASNDLDVGRKYLGENLQDLETWGWVSLKVNNKNQTYEVTLQIGREDETLRWKDIGGKNSTHMAGLV